MPPKKEKPDEGDLQWLKEYRTEQERRDWAISRLKAIVAWIGGTMAATWAGIDSVIKFLDWIRK